MQAPLGARGEEPPAKRPEQIRGDGRALRARRKESFISSSVTYILLICQHIFPSLLIALVALVASLLIACEEDVSSPTNTAQPNIARPLFYFVAKSKAAPDA